MLKILFAASHEYVGSPGSMDWKLDMKSSTAPSTVLWPPAATCARMIMAAMATLLNLGHVLAQTPDPQPPGYVNDSVHRGQL
jgi:hypothetical protein